MTRDRARSCRRIVAGFGRHTCRIEDDIDSAISVKAADDAGPWRGMTGRARQTRTINSRSFDMRRVRLRDRRILGKKAQITRRITFCAVAMTGVAREWSVDARVARGARGSARSTAKDAAGFRR